MTIILYKKRRTIKSVCNKNDYILIKANIDVQRTKVQRVNGETIKRSGGVFWVCHLRFLQLLLSEKHEAKYVDG
jgi:hypothetical protein